MGIYDVMEGYFNELFGTAEQVIDSGDTAGCTEDLVVISKQSYDHLADLVTKIRLEIAKFS